MTEMGHDRNPTTSNVGFRSAPTADLTAVSWWRPGSHPNRTSTWMARIMHGLECILSAARLIPWMYAGHARLCR